MNQSFWSPPLQPCTPTPQLLLMLMLLFTAGAGNTDVNSLHHTPRHVSTNITSLFFPPSLTSLSLSLSLSLNSSKNRLSTHTSRCLKRGRASALLTHPHANVYFAQYIIETGDWCQWLKCECTCTTHTRCSVDQKYTKLPMQGNTCHWHSGSGGKAGCHGSVLPCLSPVWFNVLHHVNLTQLRCAECACAQRHMGTRMRSHMDTDDGAGFEGGLRDGNSYSSILHIFFNCDHSPFRHPSACSLHLWLDNQPCVIIPFFTCSIDPLFYSSFLLELFFFFFSF